MRPSWLAAALTAGVLAVAGCGDDPSGEPTATAEETCAAAGAAMPELGTSLETALLEWDGTPESAGEITAVTDRWAEEFRGLAADSVEPELRALLEDLAGQLEEFGASWQAGGSGDPSLVAVDAAVQPLEDRCGFGAGAGLAGDPTGSSDACAAALAEAGGGAFERVETAARDVAQALPGGDQAALVEAVERLQAAAAEFAGGFRELAADAGDPRLRAALADIAVGVERWAASFERPGKPADLSGFRAAVGALGAICD